MKFLNKKFLLKPVFVGILFCMGFFIGANYTEAALKDNPCKSDSDCKTVCKDSYYERIKDKSSGIFIQDYLYYCTLGYASATEVKGSKKIGETCADQTDCAEGYCKYGTDPKCTAKVADGTTCGDKGITFSGSAGAYCKYMCTSGTGYEDSSSPGTYVCGKTPEKVDEATGTVPGSTESGGLVPCGRGGQSMCTLCDLVVGIKDVVDYLLKIAIGIAVLAICIGGILYIVSVGDPGLIEMGKNAMKNALIGIVVCVVAFIVINTTMLYIGTQTNLGIGVTNWYTFDCSASK